MKFSFVLHYLFKPCVSLRKNFWYAANCGQKKILEELSINNKRLDLCRKFSGSLPGFPNTGLSRELAPCNHAAASTPYCRWLLSYTTFSWYNNNVVSKGNTVLCEKILNNDKTVVWKMDNLRMSSKF